MWTRLKACGETYPAHLAGTVTREGGKWYKANETTSMTSDQWGNCVDSAQTTEGRSLTRFSLLYIQYYVIVCWGKASLRLAPTRHLHLTITVTQVINTPWPLHLWTLGIVSRPLPVGVASDGKDPLFWRDSQLGAGQIERPGVCSGALWRPPEALQSELMQWSAICRMMLL